jgi:hypothetical protein
VLAVCCESGTVTWTVLVLDFENFEYRSAPPPAPRQAAARREAMRGVCERRDMGRDCSFWSLDLVV